MSDELKPEYVKSIHEILNRDFDAKIETNRKDNTNELNELSDRVSGSLSEHDTAGNIPVVEDKQRLLERLLSELAAIDAAKGGDDE